MKKEINRERCGIVYSSSNGKIKGATCANPKPCFNNHLIEIDNHDYRFSHYEEDRNMSDTATLNGKYAIMICRHCGQYIKQQIF